MNTIPAADTKLIDELRGILDQLDKQRRDLYTRRPGCACVEDHLCAHHAAVWNHLQAASDDLARAIKQAQSEG
jgi:uncharacterized membrane-anchored protein YhcB (DUF1043 family)